MTTDIKIIYIVHRIEDGDGDGYYVAFPSQSRLNTSLGLVGGTVTEIDITQPPQRSYPMKRQAFIDTMSPREKVYTNRGGNLSDIREFTAHLVAWLKSQQEIDQLFDQLVAQGHLVELSKWSE